MALATGRRKLVSLDYNTGGVSDVGLARGKNQDAFYIGGSRKLFMVADGLGGHTGGEIACAIAVDVVRRISKLPSTDDEEPNALLQRIFSEVDIGITNRAQQSTEVRRMGISLVVALVRGQGLFVGHAGDTRAYLRHGEALARLTDDHTPVGALLQAGLIREDETRSHPARNELSKVVGGGKRPAMPDVVSHPLLEGDCFLLCTDGLWGELSAQEIAGALSSPSAATKIARSLVDKAIAAGGRDNVTAVVYRRSPISTV